MGIQRPGAVDHLDHRDLRSPRRTATSTPSAPDFAITRLRDARMTSVATRPGPASISGAAVIASLRRPTDCPNYKQSVGYGHVGLGNRQVAKRQAVSGQATPIYTSAVS